MRVTQPHAQAGFSLLEVLVSLVLIAFAFVSLGLAQVKSLRSVNSMTYHTEAVSLHRLMSERILANPVVSRQSSVYQIALGAPGTDIDCELESCTATDLAAYDMYQWKESIKAVLPNGDGSIGLNTTGHPWVYTLTIEYDDTSIAGTDERRSVELQFEVLEQSP